MADIVVTESITLDGVMQAPGREDEDPRGGFEYGGWAASFADQAIGEFMGPAMGRSTGMLFGRRSYEDLLGFWSAAPEPNPFRDILLGAPKYVVSRDEGYQPAYPNTTVLVGEAGETVADVVATLDGSLTVLGSGELARALRVRGLVTAYVLQIHPIVLGQGTRLFEEGDRDDFELVRSGASTTGVLLAEYAVKR